MRVNGEGAGHVAEAAAMADAPLLHISTDYVFDGTFDRPYREDDATGPTGAYGRSKLAGERRVVALCPNSAILRTAWVYSPFGANFVREMLRLKETRGEVGVVADHRGNPTSALDIADALLLVAKRIREGFFANASRCLSHDRRRGGDVGGFRRSGFRRSPRARPSPYTRPTHSVGRLSDARPTAGQFASRQWQAAVRLWRRAAGLAPFARGVLRAAHSMT